MATNHASYGKIGLTVLIGVAAIVGALIYLGGINGKRNLIAAETYYEKSVSGLSIGSPVNFRGVKIGEVSAIGFVGSRYEVQAATNQMVFIRMALHDEFRRFVDQSALRATVTASGITGLSRIELDLQPEVPPMPISWLPEDAVYIPPAVSLLDSFSDSATKVMNQINAMDLEKTWQGINDSIRALAGMTEGAQAVMETRRADLERMTGDFAEAVSALKELANELRENPSLLIRERIPARLPETSR